MTSSTLFADPPSNETIDVFYIKRNKLETWERRVKTRRELKKKIKKKNNKGKRKTSIWICGRSDNVWVRKVSLRMNSVFTPFVMHSHLTPHELHMTQWNWRRVLISASCNSESYKHKKTGSVNVILQMVPLVKSVRCRALCDDECALY